MDGPLNIDPLIGNPPTTNHSIKELYCVISRGPDGEGIFAAQMPNGMIMQAVTSQLFTAGQIVQTIRLLGDQKPEGVTLHLCKFAFVEEIEQVL